MSKEKEILVLGERGEVIPYDFTDRGYDVQWMTDQLNKLVKAELMSRKILPAWDWSTRVKNIFMNNRLITIEHVAQLTPQQVNRLVGCGVNARREVYEIFRDEFYININNWHPSNYWEKFKF